ncbi:GAF domain-containing protein [Leptolyngbya sp. FACHB-261]|uniref:hybrid sensor histidine kinase/response regulator n=1 Tax=Leptolyngbya sp. FACHB-261 TaxID=2692806 RepID=UPI0016829089|nr:GAF domain-containing protein [Leptolyngbya sp. FACHB-261]MBD2100334.1 GAF domain-containing protein [Leptolyngbya sp. FACHB-261]
MSRGKAKKGKQEAQRGLTQEALLNRMTNRIRQSLELQEILTATVVEIRSFLQTDRVQIYRFRADGSGEVIAQSANQERLPSLMGLSFPADDIPPISRELFVKARQRVIVDVQAQLSIISHLDSPETGETLVVEDVRYCPADPCHLEYLAAMGVQSCLVVPILYHKQLWGLLISHHSRTREYSERELQIVQLLANQVSIAISQSKLLSQAREQARQEATISKIATLLHASTKLQEVLPVVLRETVQALEGTSGRLYITADGLSQISRLYTYGQQPIPQPETENELIEDSVCWQRFMHLSRVLGQEQLLWSQPVNDRETLSLQAVNDLYHEPELRALGPAFAPTEIRGLLSVPLQYRQKLLGYLSIFRNEIEVETLWAGHRDSDERQRLPRRSFEAWRELKRGQSQEWTNDEIELAQALSNHLTTALMQKRQELEKQKMEEELIKARKLESIGILAGGIAHDFNNILTIILGNVSLAQMDAHPDSQIYARLTEARKASQRAKDLTQQLLTFSKGGAPIKKTASIAELIKDTLGFGLRGSNVKCELSIAEDLWPVEMDEGQISQVLNNLIINANQAMPDGGTVQVKVENIELEEESFLPLAGGQYVKISIQDQGIGIPEEHLSKIFDPYFTTKQKGSGLGLSTSYSIIKNHGGLIDVESELEVGTEFCIYLPASQNQILAEAEEEKNSTAGKGKILVMDDEEKVREIAGKMLTHFGYDVGFAKDGLEAVELYKKAKKADQPFDAVIMDLTVPGGVGGKEAIKKLLRFDPGVKAIVSSGYSNDPLVAQFQQYGFRGLLAKPYEIEKLHEVLSKILTEDKNS